MPRLTRLRKYLRYANGCACRAGTVTAVSRSFHVTRVHGLVGT